MKKIVVLAALTFAAAACDGDAQLTTGSTIVTGGTNAPVTTTTTDGGNGGATASPTTTLVGQSVSEYEVAASIPNDDGVTQYIVIPNGAYTDVDLQNFVFDLIESNPDLYGAEIFDNAEAASAYQVEADARTEEQNALIERHHFVTLEGRDRFIFRGPFSEFPGGVIGS